MRPADVTKDQIIDAGAVLRAAGRNITGFALRQKIGGGNPARLKQIWDEHVINDGAAPAAPSPELPPEIAERVATHGRELAERLAALAVALNADAIAAAERRVTSVLAEAASQREQVERELLDAAQMVEDLEGKLEDAAKSADVLQERLDGSQSTCQAQAIDLAQLRERLAHAEQSAKVAIEEHAAEVDRMNQAAEAERERARGAMEDQKKLVAQAQAEREQARAELAAVKARAEAAEQSHQEARKVAAQEVHRVAERLTKSESERDSARKESAAAREDAARLRGQLEALHTQIAGLTRVLAQRDGGKKSN